MKKLYLLFISIVFSSSIDAQGLYFPPLSGNAWDTMSPQSLNWCQVKIDSLYSYLDQNNTKAFMVLKDGKIVLEKYFGTHTASSPWQWASAGKTITAFMVGIAQQEGHLFIDDTTSKYLGAGWTSCTPTQEAKITIRHQLTMTSGLDDGVSDPFCTIDTCLVYKADAGTRWAYHNGPYTLLDSVIESATGITLNTYTTQKLKNPTGMTGTFVGVGYNNVFFSNARSMARFGLLMLNKGSWNGTPVMTDTAYFNQMINTSQSLNNAYGYLWWLNGKGTFMLPGPQFVFNGSINPNAPVDVFVAMGKDGQFLNVVPSQNLVIVRMGNAPDNLPVPYLMNDKIWEYVNDLTCSPSGLNDASHEFYEVKIYPNPVTSELHLKALLPITSVEIFNTQGQLLKAFQPQEKECSLPAYDLPIGLIFVKATSVDGRNHMVKVIKH